MAGLLEVFSIGFESDTLKDFETELKRNEQELDKYEKEIKKAEEALKKLKKEGKEDSAEFKKLEKTIEESQNKVKLFKDSISTMKKSTAYSLSELKKNFLALGQTVARFAVIGAAIKRSLDFYEQGEQLQFLAQRASTTADKLQTLANAAKRYGGSTEGTAGTLENLRNQYQSLRMGQGGGALEQAAFKYGVGISSDPEKMLENVARRMETLKSDAAKWDLANTLGIDEGTARLLMQGTKAYTEELKRAQKYKLYTKEDLERMREYRQISLDIRMGIDSVFGSIARMLLPAITAVSKVIRSITDWMAEHEGAVKIVSTIVLVSAVVLSAKGIIMLLAGAFHLLGLSIMNTPIGWIIAAITAIIVIVNDLIVFLQGGESVIGTILEKLGYDTDAMREDVLKFISDLKKGFAVIVEWFKKLGDDFGTMIKAIKQWWDELPEPLRNAIEKGVQFLWRGTAIGALTTAAQMSLEKYKKNPQNAVYQGAQSSYYNSQSQNENRTSNVSSIRNADSHNMSIQTMNVNVASGEPQTILDGMRTATQLDNGIMAGR